jgi:hypothetical protein
MGFAADTVLFAAVNPGAGPTAATTALSGDPASVRSFSPADQAVLDNIIRMGTTAGFVQVRTPLFHDNVRGIRITPAESPSVFSLPGEAQQRLQPQDTLTVELSGGAAETDIALLQLYYSNLPGASARLHQWGDIAGIIKSIKPIAVAVTSPATAGAWGDTLITTSENLLHANTDYAVLGYMANAALGAICLKGIDTSNLRVGGPGSTQEYPTSAFFVRMAQQTGRPYIPVFNSANANGTFVSVCAATASVAATVELICVELAQNLTN